MRVAAVILLALVLSSVPEAAPAADFSEDGGKAGFKFNFDSVPFLGEEKGETETQAALEEEPVEYTYDATGRKVPVRTEKGEISELR